MSVQPQQPIVTRIANGSTTEFDITFDLHDEKALVVTVNNEIPEVGSFSVRDNKVIFSVAPTEGSIVTLYRDSQLNRLTDYKNYDGSFNANTINWDLDKLWYVLQEQNLVDAKILARIKEEIEWRRTHDFNYDTLGQVRDAQVFGALKQYLDTILASTSPNIFGGVTAGVVFALDKKSVQTHLENIAQRFEDNRIHLDQQLSLKANSTSVYSKAETYTKTEVDNSLLSKADQAYVDQGLSSITTQATKFYPTLAAANADIANLEVNQPVQVGDAENGGLYYKVSESAMNLTKSAYDPLTQSKEFTLDQVMSVSEKIGSLVVRSLPPESGYVWGLQDPVTNKVPVRTSVDGTFEIDKILLPASSIAYENLGSDLIEFIPKTLNPESGYVWGLVDPVTDRAPVRVGVDGTFYAETIRLGKSSVSESNIDSNLSRQIIAQKEDVQQTYVDPWRATKTEIGLKTQGAGYWNQLPVFKTKAIFGVNTSGTSISIRKTANLLILGKYFAGEWSASNVASLRNVGSLTSPSVSNPSGTFVSGDYYYYANGSATESTGTYPGMNIGDLLVYNGSAWVIQKAAGTVATRGQNGYFWKVTSDCTFEGVEYKSGDFILYVTRQTGGGGWQYERWMKINKVKGDLVYMGIVSALPASPLNNTVYEVGTAFDSYSVGDYLMYSNDAWMHIKNIAETVIANNASFYLTCTDASEYEVRRADKSASSVGFSASCYIQSNVAKSTDELLLISDSMFGSGGVGAAILSESARTGTVKSFGGSTSNQVMGMLEYFVSQGDEFKGQTVIAWHGQNNQPSNAVNAALIRECSLKMQQLVGAIHSRIAFLSILGQRNLSWNASSNRYIASQHENQKAKTGNLWELQDWYNKTFPNRHISPYQILIDAADDTPDPTFPGMTEKQVAQTYGIVPYSFFGGTTGEWGDVTNLRYLGNWSSSSLPTETANQFDYYLRTGGGSASEFLLVYINGQWVQKSMDITHLSNKGATALAKCVAKFLTENKM